MPRKSDFRLRFEELERQRALLLDSAPGEDPLETELCNAAAEVAKAQLSAFKKIEEFVAKFSSSELKGRFEGASLPMPSRSAVSDFVEATKGALDIHRIALRETEVDPQRVETQKAELSGAFHSDFGNFEFNKCFRESADFFRGQPTLGNSDSVEREELGDSTVNTIISEDVSASSPF